VIKIPSSKVIIFYQHYDCLIFNVLALSSELRNAQLVRHQQHSNNCLGYSSNIVPCGCQWCQCVIATSALLLQLKMFLTYNTWQVQVTGVVNLLPYRSWRNLVLNMILTLKTVSWAKCFVLGVRVRKATVWRCVTCLKLRCMMVQQHRTARSVRHYQFPLMVVIDHLSISGLNWQSSSIPSLPRHYCTSISVWAATSLACLTCHQEVVRDNHSLTH